jgi:predicted amidophosphoribosyltransferase
MYVLLLIAAVPTVLLWWRDRRIPPGHCQNCGYDLTGNVSGICPECGQPAEDRP